ncbi:MAG: hypothetical protein ABIN36_19465 [Ferruginibacter sp.]
MNTTAKAVNIFIWQAIERRSVSTEGHFFSADGTGRIVIKNGWGEPVAGI